MDITVCPKCKHQRDPNTPTPKYECPACGVIYKKFIKANSKSDNAGAQLKAEKNLPHPQAWIKQRASQVCIVALLILSTLLVLVWTGDQRMEPHVSAESLDKAILDTQSRISAITAEQDKYTGGLLKSMLSAALATETSTLAMLNQKRQSWIHRIALGYTIDGTGFTSPDNAADQINTLNAEIEAQKAKLLVTEAKADLYSGGLIRATLLSTAASTELSLALLEQKKASLEFGFPIYFSEQDTAPPGKRSNPTPEPPKPEKLNWSITNIDSRVTESNSSWQKYAWRLELKNDEDYPLSFNATIEFQDADGFIIDDDREYGIYVPAKSEKTFTGSTLIKVPGAYKVQKTNAKVGLK